MERTAGMPEPTPKKQGLRARYQGYSGARPDVLKLVQGQPMRMLDVGCGAGMLGRDLLERSPGAHVTGVEPDPELAALARDQMTEVIEGRIDEASTLLQIAAHAPYDLILCADVLEHLAQPDVVLGQLASFLSPGGRLITSLPNIRHVSTFVSLGLLGTWPSRSRGIHDRTHLRFFARPNILQLGREAGLVPIRETRNMRLIEARPWTMIPAKALDFWPLRAFYTFQYLHLWKRSDER